ncbi:hypothetical protein MC885_003844, partial [Smutsia gigantea]
GGLGARGGGPREAPPRAGRGLLPVPRRASSVSGRRASGLLSPREPCPRSVLGWGGRERAAFWGEAVSLRALHPLNGRGGASLRRRSETRWTAAARGVPSQLSLLFQEQQKMNNKSQGTQRGGQQQQLEVPAGVSLSLRGCRCLPSYIRLASSSSSLWSAPG